MPFQPPQNTGINPKVLAEIRDWATHHNIEKVILFGSRARGDYRRTSDIDLAVKGGNITHFILDVDEQTSTLLKYDVVNLDASVQPELLQMIQKEGIILYEKI